jgi:hypothetical protein
MHKKAPFYAFLIYKYSILPHKIHYSALALSEYSQNK